VNRDIAVLPLPGRATPFAVTGALRTLVDALVAAGGRPVAVGGSVRDHLRGFDPKDIDVEVYGLELEALEKALAPFEVHAVGRAFGVLKVGVAAQGPAGAKADAAGVKETFDVSLPRAESKSGTGHKGFVITSDPHMDPKAAAARRDFTVNAIGVDLATGALVDPWHGVADLERGLLRHVSEAFDEDPLRVLRLAQFAARFAFDVAPETIERCRAIVARGELATLPVERLWTEMEKLLVKGVWPSVGLRILERTGAVDALFPELKALVGCPQEFEWHPEGDVWVHTLMVTDEAARIARLDGLDDAERLVVVLGALCHDLGKPPTTEHIDGRIRSREHETQGEPPTRSFLTRIGAPHALIDDVVALVREHLKPFQLFRDLSSKGPGAADGAVRRLSLRAPIPRLVRVANADHFGRTTPDALVRDPAVGEWLLAEAARLDVSSKAPGPILLGRHLIAKGIKPGPHMGALLKEAFEAQLEGTFVDEAGALAWLDGKVSS
jgi:tRNA nucleotidyltransferase (CCA-adding enzyme)